MKQLGKKSFGILLAITLLVGLSARSYADQISVWPDSVTMSSTIGSSTQTQINVWVTNIDSLGDTLPLQNQTARVSLTGSSQFRLMSDSILRFQYNYGPVTVQYSPTGTGISVATLTIVGDSNTVTVTLIGRPINHSSPNILVGQYQNLNPNQQACHPFEVYNTSADSIWITHVVLMQDSTMGNEWSLENLVSLPDGIAGNASDTMGQLCVNASIIDTFITGNLKVVYAYANQYGSGVDSTSINIKAWHRPINSTCVTSNGANFDTVAEGASVTKTVTFTNTTDTSVYLDSPQMTGDSHFTVDASQFPLTIPTGSSASVSVAFTAPSPTTEDNYSAWLTAQVHGTSPDGVSCNSVTAYLTAAVPVPVVDSMTLDVPPGTTTLSITARTMESRHAIFIHNGDSSAIRLQMLRVGNVDTAMRDSTLAYFGSYYNTIQDLQDTLAPGATYGPIILTLYADTGTYNIDLTLTYWTQQAHQKGAIPSSSNSLTYTVVAHRLPPLPEAVLEPNMPAPVDFTLSPNPAQGEVTIGLPQDGPSTVEIYDVLGNLLFQGTEHGPFIWNGVAGATSLANGSYIVRVSHGNAVSSKRLVLVR